MERENFDTKRVSFKQVEDSDRVKFCKKMPIQLFLFVFALVMKLVCKSNAEELNKSIVMGPENHQINNALELDDAFFT